MLSHMHSWHVSAQWMCTRWNTCTADLLHVSTLYSIKDTWRAQCTGVSWVPVPWSRWTRTYYGGYSSLFNKHSSIQIRPASVFSPKHMRKTHMPQNLSKWSKNGSASFSDFHAQCTSWYNSPHWPNSQLTQIWKNIPRLFVKPNIIIIVYLLNKKSLVRSLSTLAIFLD